MNQDHVMRVITNLGIGHFQDWVADYESIPLAVNSILKEITNYASISKLTGSGYWEKAEKALKIAIEGINEDVLDPILEKDYGIWPNQVGGSKAFFERLHSAIVEGINMAKSRNLN
jgi:hypothetical protein